MALGTISEAIMLLYAYRKKKKAFIQRGKVVFSFQKCAGAK